MNELFLQELNAITAYANNSNTVNTELLVRRMLGILLEMKDFELYGTRTCPYCGCEENKDEK